VSNSAIVVDLPFIRVVPFRAKKLDLPREPWHPYSISRSISAGARLYRAHQCNTVSNMVFLGRKLLISIRIIGNGLKSSRRGKIVS